MKRIGFFLLVSIVLLVIFLPGFSRMQELRQENRELEEKIAKIKKENQSLQNENVRLQNDMLYIEKVAREKMGITKKGETIYRISPEE